MPQPTTPMRPPAPPSMPPKPPPRMSSVPPAKPADPSKAPARNDTPAQPPKRSTLPTTVKVPRGEPKPPAKSAAAKPTAVKPAGKPQEVDPAKLEPEKLAKRLAKIYALEKIRDRKKAAHESAMKAARATKAELEQAEEDLTLEIQEQRFGPGPLWNADGSGPAGAPQADESKNA